MLVLDGRMKFVYEAGFNRRHNMGKLLMAIEAANVEASVFFAGVLMRLPLRLAFFFLLVCLWHWRAFCNLFLLCPLKMAGKVGDGFDFVILRSVSVPARRPE